MKLNPNTKTGKIYLYIFELLETYPRDPMDATQPQNRRKISRLTSQNNQRMCLEAYWKISW